MLPYTNDSINIWERNFLINSSMFSILTSKNIKTLYQTVQIKNNIITHPQ